MWLLNFSCNNLISAIIWIIVVIHVLVPFVWNEMKWLVFQSTILHLQGYTRPGITWANEKNIVLNHALVLDRSICWPAVQRATTVPRVPHLHLHHEFAWQYVYQIATWYTYSTLNDRYWPLRNMLQLETRWRCIIMMKKPSWWIICHIMLNMLKFPTV